MVAAGKGGSPGGYRSGIESTGEVGWMLGGTHSKSSAKPAPGTFHNIFVTWDGSILRTYIDGVADANTTPKSGTMGGSSSTFYIGRSSSGYEFGGFIDEVRVSNQSLSADWVQAQHRSMTNTYISYE